MAKYKEVKIIPEIEKKTKIVQFSCELIEKHGNCKIVDEGYCEGYYFNSQYKRHPVCKECSQCIMNKPPKGKKKKNVS